MSVQKLISTHPAPGHSGYAYWKEKENERIFLLSNKALGDFGESFVAALFEGIKQPDNRGGFDVKAGDKLIEVKTARKSFSKTNVAYSWNQIRLDKKHTHLALLAISPENANLYILDEAGIKNLRKKELLKHQRSKKSLQLKLSEENIKIFLSSGEHILKS